MENDNFLLEANMLLEKVKNLAYGDYETAKEVVLEFERVVQQYGKTLNPYILKDIVKIKKDLETSQKYKREDLKYEYWHSGIKGLTFDIDSFNSNETASFNLNLI